MGDANEIADSTDWLKTPLAGLAPLENALHCQICKEFFDTPMLTTCCHTFCSKCIRTALSTDGCCPACRSQDQPSKLRNNWQVQELVSAFLDARPTALKVAREQQDRIQNSTTRPGKRKRGAATVDEPAQEEGGRSLRRKSQRLQESQSLQASQRSVSDAASDGDYIEDEPVVQLPPDDGLVECPMGCGQRMKIEQVEPHLDRCEDERRARDAAAARAKAAAANPKYKERLSEFNYSMMKERDLGRKMKDLGIPITGGKHLMVRRHTAWVNIWNANCDSSKPREKNELLRELAAWERTHGGGASNHSHHGVMKKDFDGGSWMTKNSDDFSRLIADARRSRTLAAAKTEESEAETREHSPSSKELCVSESASEISHSTIQGPAQTIPADRSESSSVPEAVAPSVLNGDVLSAFSVTEPERSDLEMRFDLPTTTKMPMFASQN